MSEEVDLELGTFWKYARRRRCRPGTRPSSSEAREASNYLWGRISVLVPQTSTTSGHSGVIAPERAMGDSRIPFGTHDYRTGVTSASPSAATTSRPRAATPPSSMPSAQGLREPVDVFRRADWPRGIAHHGDLPAPSSGKKKFLADEIRDGSLGSPPAEELMRASTAVLVQRTPTRQVRRARQPPRGRPSGPDSSRWTSALPTRLFCR